MTRIITLFMLFAAVTAMAQEVRITPLDYNSNSDDFAPSPTNHGRMLIISSERSGEQQLYSMERTSTGWTEPSKLSGDVNDAGHAGSAALSSDGQTMVFAAYEHDVPSTGRTDLYMAFKHNGSWEQVENLGGIVNSREYDSQPSLSADGRTLFFVSDRSGGKGGTDIYWSSWTVKGWSVPRPVDGVNSASNEMSPSIAADGKTLTFASDRSGGSGGYDIYMTTVENGKASAVRRAGNEINTSADELFYMSIPNSNQAYFTRMNANGDYDNFLAVPNPFPSEPVTLVEGTVRDIETRDPLGADLIVTDLSTGKSVASLRSDDRDGSYYVTLTPGRRYSVTAKRTGYLFHSEQYNIPPSAEGTTIRKDIDLSPLKGGGNRLLVFFDYDKAELKTESYPELERVIELMRENSGLRMSFEGHTDDQGSDDYNMELSKRRAKAVVDYVTNGGIESGRVRSSGYGESRPLVKEDTDAARAMNRRVEMKVLD